MDGRDEAAGGEAEEDAGGKVVFAEAVAELEVLVEHGAQGEGDGLCWGWVRWGVWIGNGGGGDGDGDGVLTLRRM